MKNSIIWSSEINLADWQDILEDEGLLEADESVKYRRIEELNAEYLEDERMNLQGIKTKNEIICFADLGLWDGRHKGSKCIGTNVKDILYTDCENATWYSDGLDIRCDACHHDGTNYYLYREIVGDTPKEIEENKEKLFEDGTFTEDKIGKYTRSILPYMVNLYGISDEIAKELSLRYFNDDMDALYEEQIIGTGQPVIVHLLRDEEEVYVYSSWKQFFKDSAGYFQEKMYECLDDEEYEEAKKIAIALADVGEDFL